MYLYGKNSVKERLAVNPSSIVFICVKHDFYDKEMMNLIKKNKIRLHKKADRDVGRYVPGKKHQGIIAKVSRYVYTSLDAILVGKDLPNLMILDRIQDPQNVGTIIRTLACLGKINLCLTKHRSCLITESVIHVASGGENYVPITVISQLIPFIKRLKQKGYYFVGSFVNEGQSLYEYSFTRPCAVFLGSEHSGLSVSLKKYLDDVINIPMGGAKMSLNVNNTASIIAYEMIRKIK